MKAFNSIFRFSAWVLCPKAYALIKKRKEIFLIYKQIQSGAVIYEEGLPIYEEMRKYFPIYQEAVSHVWLCNYSIPNFLIYEENLIFFFISAAGNEEKYIPLVGKLFPILDRKKCKNSRPHKIERPVNPELKIRGGWKSFCCFGSELSGNFLILN